MGKPLGIIVNQNPIMTAVDVYALVLNNLVVNTILASYNDIVSVSATYDYSVDITMGGQAEAGIGDTYNASQDTFIAPPAPPMNWVANAQSDFDSIIGALQQVVIDCGPSGGNLTSNQISTAYNSSLNDNPGLDTPTLNLMSTILQYVLAGG
jgi:hypothetical protein